MTISQKLPAKSDIKGLIEATVFRKPSCCCGYASKLKKKHVMALGKFHISKNFIPNYFRGATKVLGEYKNPHQYKSYKKYQTSTSSLNSTLVILDLAYFLALSNDSPINHLFIDFSHLGASR